jgi:hypothetical protein
MKGARAPKPGHLKGTPFACGPMVPKRSDCKVGFGVHRANQERLYELNRRVKLFHGPEGWFADGTQGQLWEYGKGKLGFTVGSGVMVSKAILNGFTPTQSGDGEANFSCEWTEEAVERLIRLLHLRKRKGYPSNPLKGKESAQRKPI